MTWIYSVAKVRKKKIEPANIPYQYIYELVLCNLFSRQDENHYFVRVRSCFVVTENLCSAIVALGLKFCPVGVFGVFELFCYWVWNYDAPGPKFKKFVETTKKTFQFSSSLQQSRIDQGLYNHQAPSRLGKWCAITMAFLFHYRTNRKSSTWVKLGRLFADVSFDSRTRCFLLAFRPDSFTFGGW